MKSKVRLSRLRGSFLIALAGLSFLFASCDDAEGRIELDNTAPAQVTGVTGVAGPGEVTLTWTNPSSSSFMYTKIVYTDANGEETYQLVAKDKTPTATIKGFADAGEKQFSLYACSVRGNHGDPVQFSFAPDSPAFLQVINTITLEPTLGGVLVNYENEFNTTIVVSLEYHAASDASKSGSTQFEVEPLSQGPQLMMLTDANNEFLEGECIVSVTAQDEYGNASDPVEMRVTPLKASKIDRTGWSFPGYDANSNSGTIGYSSQETVGEGSKDGLPNGHVISMIDNSLNTYWHASWKGTSTSYPHWFILDMGREVMISSVEFTRRQGDARGQAGQRIYTCSAAGATNASNPDSWAWEDQGSFSFNVNSDAPQACGLASTPTARYIKVYFGTEHKGTGNQAMLADLNVYGAEQ